MTEWGDKVGGKQNGVNKVKSGQGRLISKERVDRKRLDKVRGGEWEKLPSLILYVFSFSFFFFLFMHLLFFIFFLPLYIMWFKGVQNKQVCRTKKFISIFMDFEKLYKNHHTLEKFKFDVKFIMLLYSSNDIIMHKLKN